MNFEPRTILVPLHGNNARTGVVSVRLMNDTEATPQQLSELAHRFFLHKVNVQHSLAGFLTRHGELSDGSRFQFVSNSGLDHVMLWPKGAKALEETLADWFRAIPTSDSFTSGAASAKPSHGWKLPGTIGAWPTGHKAISANIDHPGHVTWSNPSLTFERKPIVLSWRGPRDRYSATTGHATATGGGIVAHERDQQSIPAAFNVLQMAEDVFTDGPFVWINGHKVNTGIPKVIAACLLQWDPSSHPGEFVLRVCADRTIASPTRQMVVYDLVPTVGATGAALKAFAKAKTPLVVKATYLAADNTNAANPGGGSPGAGKWDYWQRPHFNRSGTRLATLICKVGADGTSRESHAVSFDPTTWVIVDDFTASIAVTGSTTFTGTTTSWTSSYDDTQTFFIACDFDGDTFVYAKLTVQVQSTQSGLSEGSVAPSFQAGTQDRSYTMIYTVTHSVLGTLKTWTSTNVMHLEYHVTAAGTGLTHYTGNFHWDIANATAEAITRARASKPMEIAFVGDLSKKTFALGYPKQSPAASYNMAGTLDVITSSGGIPPSVPVTASRTRVFMVFDLYFDGVKIVTAGSGGFTPAANESGSGGYSEHIDPADEGPDPIRTSTTNTGGVLARYNVTSSPVGPPSYDGRFGGATDTLRCPQFMYGGAPRFQQIAVHPEKGAAYIGAAFYKDNTVYGGSTPVPQGLEFTVVAPNGVPDAEPVIAYITGTHPTLSAPVFMGLSAASGETT